MAKNETSIDTVGIQLDFYSEKQRGRWISFGIESISRNLGKIEKEQENKSKE